MRTNRYLACLAVYALFGCGSTTTADDLYGVNGGVAGAGGQHEDTGAGGDTTSGSGETGGADVIGASGNGTPQGGHAGSETGGTGGTATAGRGGAGGAPGIDAGAGGHSGQGAGGAAGHGGAAGSQQGGAAGQGGTGGDAMMDAGMGGNSGSGGSLTPDAGKVACPADLPSDGAKCPRVNLRCEYGEDPRGDKCNDWATCTAMGRWQVTESVCGPVPIADNCPNSAMQATGKRCDVPSSYCDYDGVWCVCDNCGPGIAVCTQQNTWHCDTPPKTEGCPAAKPNQGVSCDKNGLVCNYDCGAGGGRTCSDGMWMSTSGGLCPL